ncbi:MAG: hypothetical protein E6Z25_00110 [Negativicoccus succinicivorans]|nr:hypothetical protein [Negativicoccus succinicivorans]
MCEIKRGAELADELRNARTGETYDEFVKKFETKKTTDDCYTPPAVYDAVKDWAVKEYGINEAKIVRPFYPGGDYERYDYSDGAVVVDNPPFSLISKIIDFYQERNVPFFLFCPGLTFFSTMVGRPEITGVIIETNVIYENGASVPTCFLTNLDDVNVIRTAPDLNDKLKEIQESEKASLPKFTYPNEVVNANRLKKLVRAGVKFEIPKNGGHMIRRLDAQRPIKKAIFGAGMLINSERAEEFAAAERAAAERAAAERAHVFELSERERAIINELQ